MGGGGILAHHLRVPGDGSLKRPGIDAFLLEEAVSTLPVPEHTDYLAEGVAETASEGGTFVCGQKKRRLGFDGKDETGERKLFQNRLRYKRGNLITLNSVCIRHEITPECQEILIRRSHLSPIRFFVSV
jgi:hypothetical protein